MNKKECIEKRKAGSIYISGAPGCGKTASIKELQKYFLSFEDDLVLLFYFIYLFIYLINLFYLNYFIIIFI